MLSSDSQAMWSSRRLSRSKLSTAMSASETGDCASPLVQLFSGFRNIDSANAPASRTLSSRRAACCCRSTSLAGNSHTLQTDRRRIRAVAEYEIVRRRQAHEDIGEMPGDGDFAHRIGQFAVLDP